MQPTRPAEDERDADAGGDLALVLHAHLPFVRHPEHAYHLEENWLYEALTATYLPLIEVLRDVHSERLAPPRAADGESHGKGEDGLPEHRGVGGASELVPALPPDRTQGTEAKDRPASAEVRPKNKREP